MKIGASPRPLATTRPPLKLHVPSSVVASATRWLINGFPATVIVWTAEEWNHLTVRPEDAQEGPNGIWCALRME